MFQINIQVQCLFENAPGGDFEKIEDRPDNEFNPVFGRCQTILNSTPTRTLADQSQRRGSRNRSVGTAKTSPLSMTNLFEEITDFLDSDQWRSFGSP